VGQRLFEQYLWSGRGLGGSIALRTRLEQRWADGNDGLAWRVRQQVRYVRPFSPGSHYSLVATEEFIAHVNDTQRYARGFDQNRAFGGISRAVNAKMRFEAGYLNQYQHSLVGRDRLNHILSIATAIAF
jgi:hypothetical protein